MGRVQGTQVGEIPQPGEPVGSTLPNFQAGGHVPIGNSPAPNFQAGGHLPIGNSWSSGLFDCHLHQTNAIITAILPCVTFGQIAEVLDEGNTTCPMGTFMYLLTMPVLCSQWILGSNYRAKLRRNYNLVEAPYTDVISHIFCLWCSLCQEFRELQNRGLDPALGWNGILAQRNQAAMAPPPNQFMSK
ncbi:Plant cadmium resistance 2 [Melia azedarach]|uniref:Plant cadmium resistance 2 n=1 Tax=Melia azedarach TaxID=155640 RepID=A0ACC1YUQ8_MELAZ|nr:Plant cadmium resistance 2 [Melia azedarach]